MTEVLHANVFFFITSIAVIIFTVLLCIVLYHLIKLAKSIRRIVERVEVGSEIIAADLEHIRSYFTEQSLLSRVLRGMMGAGNGPRHTSRSAPSRKASDAKARTELKIKDED